MSTSFSSTGLFFSVAALAALAVPQLGARRVAPAPGTDPGTVAAGVLDTPTGVDVPGETLPAAAFGPAVIESMDVVLARAAQRVEPDQGPGPRGGHRPVIHAPAAPASRPEPTAVEEGASAAPSSPVATLPNLMVDFPGPDQNDPGADWFPPYPNGAAGPNYFVALVNQHLSIYDKATTVRVLSVSLQSFFGGSTTVEKFSPRVLYDHFADRWVIIASDLTSGIHFAWTTSGDPTASWFKTSILLASGADAGTWPDYPTLGLDSRGVYVGAYMVGNSLSLFAIDKTPLLNLVPSIGTVTAWRSLPWEGALQPCLTYGNPPGCYVTSRFSVSSQRIRRINPPLTGPTLTQIGFITTKNGQPPPDAPALGSSVDLDTLDARHMNAVYRAGAIWLTHCVDKAGRAAINWYEFDPTLLSVIQEGTVKSDTDSYFYPSLALNSDGDALLGFSASSPAIYAGAWYTGRKATDPLGEMAGPVQYKVGGGSYNQTAGGVNPWGYYSMTTVDPFDSLSFWTIQEHAGNSGLWGTRIAQLQFSGCASPTATQPANATNCPGTSVSFSTTAGGTGPFTYQWRKDGLNVPGATSSTYMIAAVTAQDAGSYTCVVSDGCGATSSPPGVLTVETPVSATDPAGANVCLGASASFATTASGTAPFTYQWRKDGLDISGASASTYDLPAVAFADAGDYDVVVTGACSSVVTTAPATLVVSDAVTASDPAGATECPGASVSFATTAGGTGPFTYQWRKDGLDISGASASTYDIPAVSSADAGDYDVVVAGACSFVVTAPATLIVNDDVTGSDPAGANVCLGASASFATTAGGTGPFTYQWRKDGLDIPGASASTYDIPAVSFGDAGDYDVVVGGACGSVTTAPATLVVSDAVTASDPAGASECPGASVSFATTAGGTGPFTFQWRKDGLDISGASASTYDIPAVSSADAGDYDAVVTGACSSVTTAPATLVVDDPVTASDPAGASECPGASVSFATTAGGTGPFTYQWRKDGLDIPGASASTYDIPAVSSADAGDYDVVVTGACGAVTTAPATLVVDDPVTASDPAGASECPGASVSFATTAGGTGPFTYQWRKDGLDIPGASASTYDISAVSSADAGDYDVVVTGACGAVTTAPATLVVDDPVTASDPAGATECPGASVSFATTAGGTGPITYQWRKDGLDIPGASASTYDIPAVSSADAGDYDVVVTGACGAVTTAPATLVVDDPVTASDPAGASACPGAGVSFATTAGGTGPFTYQWRKDGLDIPGASASTYDIPAVSSADAGDYDVVVTGACGAVTTAAATLVVDDPVTASDPAGASECPGASVSFATTAGGTGPITYQWRKDGLDIPGASASTYDIPAVSSADAGDYDVVVSGACGAVTTAAATLVVDDPVTASDPVDLTTCAGAPASFDTTAGGTGPLTFQWKKDGLAIGGATAAAYTIPAVSSGDAGQYSVKVTGACGTLETSAAKLTVGVIVTSYCTAGTSAGGCQAILASSGTPSASQASGFVVIATGVEGQKDGLFFFGKNGRQTNSWGNSSSFQCIVPPVRRGGLINGNGTSGQCNGIFGQDLNARWQAKPNHNPGAGATVEVQFWYRDPASTSNQSTALSDALEFPVCP